MADAAVSNTAEGNLVWVRLPPSVPVKYELHDMAVYLGAKMKAFGSGYEIAG